jgi:hypothetical protein
MKQSRLTGALCAALLSSFSFFANAAAVSGQGTWEMTLQGRDLDGNSATIEAYYDTALNITWLADLNYGLGSSYDSADGASNGLMTWTNANAWAAGLNPYGSGITGWRLPMVGPVNGSTLNYNSAYDGTTDVGYNISAPGTLYAGSTASEMAHMFYVTLGNVGIWNTDGSRQDNWAWWNLYDSANYNSGPFPVTNVSSGANNWAATEYEARYASAFMFSFYYGLQGNDDMTNTGYAWAVHSGDVGAPIPVPAAVWLFGSGLIGLLGVVRRRYNSAAAGVKIQAPRAGD